MIETEFVDTGEVVGFVKETGPLRYRLFLYGDPRPFAGFDEQTDAEEYARQITRLRVKARVG